MEYQEVWLKYYSLWGHMMPPQVIRGSPLADSGSFGLPDNRQESNGRDMESNRWFTDTKSSGELGLRLLR